MEETHQQIGSYTFDHWTTTVGGGVGASSYTTANLTNVTQNMNVYAVYKIMYTVRFYNTDGSTLLDTQYVEQGGTATYGGASGHGTYRLG